MRTHRWLNIFPKIKIGSGGGRSLLGLAFESVGEHLLNFLPAFTRHFRASFFDSSCSHLQARAITRPARAEWR
jgi:hypothetical protein